MTLEKYLEVVDKFKNEFNVTAGPLDWNPESWLEVRKLMSVFIKQVDEVHEVYESENRVK